MKRSFKGIMLSSVAAACLFTSGATFAQDTTSSIRGNVTSEAGVPLGDQTITITDTRSGTVRTIQTSNSGSFFARGLKVGGPYTIRIHSDDYQDEVITDVYLTLGGTFNANVQLEAPTEGIEEIVITAQSLRSAMTAIGPNSTFDLSDLEDSPAINRDIKDIIRQDARVYIDEAFADGVQCAGANSRFNSLTVDGVGLNDNFGLNGNGYPTTRIPFSFDSIQQVAVELAPFDVEYGAFTACNINAVTKSGSNEFHGGAFFDYTNDSLQGNSLQGDKFTIGDFSEKRYGATLGGPIIKDKLFFFASYEKLEGAQLFDRGPAGSGRAREVAGVSQTQFDEIVRIANEVYNYDPGGLPASLPIKDEKILAKIDWNITEGHRLSLTYTYNDGFAISQSDGDDDELELSNHYYERGAELNSYAGSYFADWSDKLSSEIRVSKTTLDNRQLSLGGTDFGEVRIETFNDADGDGIRERALVYLGADDSRQANKLNYTTWNYKAALHYQIDDHLITAGFERVTFDIFNLFVQEAEGEFRFRGISSLGLDAIEAFEQGRPERVIFENPPSLNVNDAAANFKYGINSFYLQDEFVIPDAGLSITAGIRRDWYTSNDLPRENPNFVARNGFSNAQNFDGRGIWMPRLGFTWDAAERVQIHGGVGIYSGGNPNVWLSNNYSNDGQTQVESQLRDHNDGAGSPTLFTDPTNGAPIFNIPTRLEDAVSSGTVNSGTNAIDPNFKIPTQLKIALGTVIDFDAPFGLGDDYRLYADFLYSKTRNAARIFDATLEQFGTAPDGRPLYASVDRSDPDCVDPLAGSCSRRFFASDYILTNAEGGKQTVFSLALSKSYDNGVDWTLAYAYTDAKDATPMTSSVAFSNFSQFATSSRNDPQSATSNYEIPHRFTFTFKYRKDFFGDNTTTFSLFGSLNQGRPFSHTFVDGGGSFNFAFTEFGDGVDGGGLLYIPTGPSDPLVNFGTNFNTGAFFDYLEANDLMKYAGGIAPRNASHSNWWGKVDLKLEQELPVFNSGHKVSVYMVIENFTNFLNDDWGVQKEASFPRNFQIVDARIDRVANVYNFNEFFERSQGRVTNSSTYEIRFGVKYKF